MKTILSQLKQLNNFQFFLYYNNNDKKDISSKY